MRSVAAAVVPFIVAAAFGWPTPVPTTAPQPVPTVLWDGAAATSFELDVRPYDVSPDGEARALVRLRFRAGAGAPTRLRRGADFDYFPTRGAAQWQTRLRFGGPAALVALRDDGPAAVRVVANRPAGLAPRRAPFDTRGWPGPRVVAAAVGPHLVRVGWFPRVVHGAVRVERLDPRGRRVASVLLPGPVSSWDDPGVQPGRRRALRGGAAGARPDGGDGGRAGRAAAQRRRPGARQGRLAGLLGRPARRRGLHQAGPRADRRDRQAGRAALRRAAAGLRRVRRGHPGREGHRRPPDRRAGRGRGGGGRLDGAARGGVRRPGPGRRHRALPHPGRDPGPRPGGRPRAGRRVHGQRSGRLRRAARLPGRLARRGRAAHAAGRDGRGPVPRAPRRDHVPLRRDRPRGRRAPADDLLAHARAVGLGPQAADGGGRFGRRAAARWRSGRCRSAWARRRPRSRLAARRRPTRSRPAWTRAGGRVRSGWRSTTGAARRPSSGRRSRPRPGEARPSDLSPDLPGSSEDIGPS